MISQTPYLPPVPVSHCFSADILPDDPHDFLDCINIKLNIPFLKGMGDIDTVLESDHSKHLQDCKRESI